MSAKPRRQPDARIIHLDSHILVVDKPAGVLTIPGRDGGPALPDVLRSLDLVPRGAELRIVHRLDRGASGVVVLAQTLDAQRRLTEQFTARRVEKLYLALVDGYVSSDGEVDLPLLVDKRKKRVRVDRTGGKPAVTRFGIVERLAGLTLLECRPLTGRLHQIRVHLASIGHPLAVDPLYGGGRKLLLSDFKPGYRPNRRREELPLIDRLTLHAFRLTLEHPAGSGSMTFEAPPAKDFRATLGQLRRLHPRPG